MTERGHAANEATSVQVREGRSAQGGLEFLLLTATSYPTKARYSRQGGWWMLDAGVVIRGIASSIAEVTGAAATSTVSRDSR